MPAWTAFGWKSRASVSRYSGLSSRSHAAKSDASAATARRILHTPSNPKANDFVTFRRSQGAGSRTRRISGRVPRHADARLLHLRRRLAVRPGALGPDPQSVHRLLRHRPGARAGPVR